MIQMRAWADHYKTEPSLFEVASLRHVEDRFRREFRNASHVSGFARAFEGELLGEKAWRITLQFEG
jgi:hypothetical protein